MAIKNDLIAIRERANSMLNLLALKATPTFRIESIDLVVNLTDIQPLVDKLTNDFNTAKAEIKVLAAGL